MVEVEKLAYLLTEETTVCIMTDLLVRWWETHHFLLVLQLELFLSTTPLLLSVLLKMIHWHLSKRYNDRSGSLTLDSHQAPSRRLQAAVTPDDGYCKRLACLLCTTADARLNRKLRKLHKSFVPASPTSSRETLSAWPHDLWDKSRSISLGGKSDEHLSKGCTGHLLGHWFSLSARKENCVLEEVILSNTRCHNSSIFIAVAKWQDSCREKRLA